MMTIINKNGTNEARALVCELLAMAMMFLVFRPPG